MCAAAKSFGPLTIIPEPETPAIALVLNDSPRSKARSPRDTLNSRSTVLGFTLTKMPGLCAITLDIAAETTPGLSMAEPCTCTDTLPGPGADADATVPETMPVPISDRRCVEGEPLPDEYDPLREAGY